MTKEEAQTIIGNIPIYGDDCYSITEYQEAKAMAIQALEQSPCEDAVSREATIKYLCTNMCWYDENGDIADDDAKESAITDLINGIPSVTPIRPKGEWLLTHEFLAAEGGSIDYIKCSCCGEWSLEQGDFCPNCGADMRGDTE